MFVGPKMGYVRAKIGLTGQFDRRKPSNYLKLCDDFRLGCRNVSQFHPKRSLSRLPSPGRSYLSYDMTPRFKPFTKKEDKKKKGKEERKQVKNKEFFFSVLLSQFQT